jgi:hypothetical protein
MPELTQKILRLEDKLLHTNFSNESLLIDQILAPNFKEISVSGCVIKRSEVVDWLLTKNVSSRWEFLEFNVEQLNPDLVLATYQAKRQEVTDSNYQGSLNSSLWQYSDGTWQMVFHQTTRLTTPHD